MKEKDEAVMKFLKKIEYVKIDESEYSFELRFHFAANDYFTNEVLKKTFYMKEEDLAEKSLGTEIVWKEGKNITKKTIKKVIFFFFFFGTLYFFGGGGTFFWGGGGFPCTQ